MQTEQILYNGHTIVITSEDDQINLTIDGESVPVQHVADGFIAAFHSPHLKHDSILELATHVIDHVIEQRAR